LLFPERHITLETAYSRALGIMYANFGESEAVHAVCVEMIKQLKPQINFVKILNSDQKSLIGLELTLEEISSPVFDIE